MNFDPSRKILTLAQAGEVTAYWPHHRLVATNGCFDILHAGHIRFLAHARSLGDLLVVGLNDDASVRALKGPARPINRAEDRALVLAALECVNLVVIFPGTRATDFLRAVRPSLWVKGGDYALSTLDPSEVLAVTEAGGEVKILPYAEGYSTTGTLARLTP